MRNGFIFDTGRCVGCGACTAACSLRNGWKIKPRNIVWWNCGLKPGLPVFSVSIACNHCEDPACLKGCPSAAYTRIGDAVVLNQEKCIGCRYCIWNCPYDGPLFEEGKGVAGKCHSCYMLLDSGDLPACSSACPTGALSYGELNDEALIPGWFPATGMKPSVQFNNYEQKPLEIYPEPVFREPGVVRHASADPDDTTGHLSLLIFTVLSLFSVAVVASSLFTERLNGYIAIPLIVAAALSSLFHPGKPLRSWRAISNLRLSPLSREIVLFLVYSALALLSVLSHRIWPVFASSVAGLALLASIDLVYLMPYKKAAWHSGQVFPAGLMLIALLSGEIAAFSFIASIRIFLSIRMMVLMKGDKYKAIRFVRIALLAIAWTAWLTGVTDNGWAILLLVFAGEIIDRFLFYRDFRPPAFSEFFKTSYKEALYEKKRS